MASRQKLRFTSEHIKLIRDQFKLVDSDGDNIINENEFRTLFRSFGQTVSNKKLNFIVSNVFDDSDNPKGIDFETFLNSFIKYYSPPITEKTLREAFSVFADEMGQVDKARLFNLLTTKGERLTKQELDEFSQAMGIARSATFNYRKLAEDMHTTLSHLPTVN